MAQAGHNQRDRSRDAGSGKHNGHGRRLWGCWPLVLGPVAGMFALVWFLVRVIPKPSRATYPCQRVAFPLASGFVAWLLGLTASAAAHRRAGGLLRRSRYVAAGLCLAAAVLAVWWSMAATGRRVSAAFYPLDPPNSPMGIARGVNPGRVVWVRDANAVTWDGYSGNWWDEGSVSQEAVDKMVSDSIRWLAGKNSDAEAWDAIFRHFNESRGFGGTGYISAEKVAIKVNMNQDSGDAWSNGDGMPTPQVLYSVLKQLIDVVGVPGASITVYDASRCIGDPLYNKIRSNTSADFQQVRFVVNPEQARSGRAAAQADTANPVHYADPAVGYSGATYLPYCVTGARYIINMALFRGHDIAGITSLAKNHFGSVWHDVSSHSGWTPRHMHDSCDVHDRPMGSPNALVDLMGHRHLGGKTLLFMIDALYGHHYQGSGPIRFQSFGNDWCKSIFTSQDGVALESVALDFLRNEPVCDDRVRGAVDNYLHEAALADSPPSGVFYDPEGDGTRLESLGVHEHWNNAADKQYSRNLGTGDGIELVTSRPPPAVDFNKDGVVNFLDFAIFSEP